MGDCGFRRIAVSILSGWMLNLVVVVAAGATDPQSTTPAQVFHDMRGAFRPDRAKGVHLRYQFDLSGPQGGQWWIEVNDGKFKIGQGRIEQPDVVFLASDKDWVALSNGTLSGTWAMLTGRLKVHGNQWNARKLDEMFP